MTDLSSLIERIEAATEGGRELDALIDAAIYGGRASHTFTDDNPASRLRRSYGIGTVFDHNDPNINGGNVLLSMTRHAPHYTSSLDAALTLLPERHDWSLFFDNGAALAGCQPVSEDGCDITDTPGATPALALLAAILRARQAADTET